MKNMITLFWKETSLFFNSLIAYLTIIIFLVGMGLFFWVFQGNVLDSGEAQMDGLFALAPWFFLFLIPAITMRMFSEEFKTGTIELIFTKPFTDWQIILGKYFAAIVLVFFSLIPTSLYYSTLYFYAEPLGNIDTGAILGSYLGLFALGAIFAAIGIFASAFTDNQIIAFIIGVFLCFTFYIGFDYLAELPIFSAFSDIIAKIGINDHYRSISRGVVDTRDVIYYLSAILFFLFNTSIILELKRK